MSEKQATHTALPWEADSTGHIYREPGDWNPDDEANPAIAIANDIEDAAFIVRACNAHDALVEAAKEMFGAFSGRNVEHEFYNRGDQAYHSKLVRNMRAALDLAHK